MRMQTRDADRIGIEEDRNKGIGIPAVERAYTKSMGADTGDEPLQLGFRNRNALKEDAETVVSLP